MADTGTSTTCRIPVPRRDVSCQDLLSQSDVINHGFLRRRKMFNSWIEGIVSTAQIFKWNREYAVLHAGCLYLFKHETATRALFATSLYGFNQVATCDQSEVVISVSWPFKLISEVDVRDCVYYFSSPSRTDTEKWIKCLHRQMLYANGLSIDIDSDDDEKKQSTDPQQQQQQQRQQQGEQKPVLAPRARPVPSNTAIVTPTKQKPSTPPSPSPSPSPPSKSPAPGPQVGQPKPQRAPAVVPEAAATTVDNKVEPRSVPRPRLAPPLQIAELQIEVDSDDEDDYDTLYETPQETQKKEQFGSKMLSGLKRGMTNVSVRLMTGIKKSPGGDVKSATLPAPSTATKSHQKTEARSPATATTAPAAVTTTAEAAGSDRTPSAPRALPPTPLTAAAAAADNGAADNAASQALRQKPVRAVKPTTAPKPSSEPSNSSSGNSQTTAPATAAVGPRSRAMAKVLSSVSEEYDDIAQLQAGKDDVSADNGECDLQEIAFCNKSAMEAEELMQSTSHEGAFMLRKASGDPGKFTLMVRIKDIVRKFKIHTDEYELFYLTPQAPHFNTISQLLQHYMNNSLPPGNASQQRLATLTLPYSAAN